jgi:hypothetical protein
LPLRYVPAMLPDEFPGPNLEDIVVRANAVGLEYVVIGGFAVIALGHFRRTTEDVDLLIPNDCRANTSILCFLERIGGKLWRDNTVPTLEDVANADVLRISSLYGIVRLLRGGSPPLDYCTVAQRATPLDIGGQSARFADLSSIVGFKRLAGRPRDCADLIGLEEIHGKLPIDPIPSLDIETE